ncbi:peroxiredoxin [Rhodanobacter sp. C06]|uniref:peroxiredoxin n=1 Tax=Rhodanobacter sp. C06 TaxID=1945854 RepID=UPI0009865FF8|nr:peroxiredoxin [Rhodanobacter sp. C06]OOG44098.1 peroxiredoxin [Rhodanobacter sp. C06]
MKNRYMSFMTASALAASVLLALPAFAALNQGAKAPDFTAEASLAGKDFSFSLQNALKKGPVVVYFYPAAYTGGCDIEAHTFATQKASFDKAGATIIGVSADSILRLNTFSSDPNYCAGKFPVASDADGRIAASYGLKLQPAEPGATDVRGHAIDHGFIPRTTFVIGRDGKIIAAFSSEADHLHPQDHVTKSLAIVQHLQAGAAP